jgi:hypothetical protein
MTDEELERALIERVQKLWPRDFGETQHDEGETQH